VVRVARPDHVAALGRRYFCGDPAHAASASEAEEERAEYCSRRAKSIFISGYDILYQAQKGSSSASGAAQMQPQVYSIAADDKDIYWIDLGTNGNSFKDGSIRHCGIDGSGSVNCATANGDIIAMTDQNPRVIVLDQKAVYWTVQAEGSVYRLAR